MLDLLCGYSYFGRSFLLHAVSRSKVIVVVSGWFYRDEISQSTLSGLGLKMAVRQMAGNMENLTMHLQE